MYKLCNYVKGPLHVPCHNYTCPATNLAQPRISSPHPKRHEKLGSSGLHLRTICSAPTQHNCPTDNDRCEMVLKRISLPGCVHTWSETTSTNSTNLSGYLWILLLSCSTNQSLASNHFRGSRPHGSVLPCFHQPYIVRHPAMLNLPENKALITALPLQLRA